jgi:hypothetical protein
MLEVRKKMHELRICPRVSLSGPCVQDVSKLTVRERGQEDFVLHRVHPEHRACQAFLSHFAEQTGTEPLDYHGESPGAVLSSAFDLLARSGKVRNVSQATRSEIFAAQTGLCADCGDRLTRFEVDHRTPLFLGGSNDRENLAAVCPPCHRAKCLGESQLHISDQNPLTSRLNRETYQLFHLSRKPPQMVAEVHPARPELKTLQVDVVRCRFTQFLENVHELPIFCALDDIQPARAGVLGDYKFRASRQGVRRARPEDSAVPRRRLVLES